AGDRVRRQISRRRGVPRARARSARTFSSGGLTFTARRKRSATRMAVTTMKKGPALGKGLSALIPDVPETPVRSATLEADIDRLSPNDFQPRGALDTARLEELAQSIRANGVIQPIVVRRVGDRFQIIAGERRWRAARLAGLQRVPVVVKDV